MVALVTDVITNDVLSLHRTWVLGDGSKNKAPVDTPRLTWPGLPSKGGCIRLWPDEEITQGLCIAEGIETALTAARGFGSAWATIDAHNLAKFPVLAGIDALTIVADHDKKNPKTGRRAGNDAAQACTNRWVKNGIEVLHWQAAEEDKTSTIWATS